MAASGAKKLVKVAAQGAVSFGVAAAGGLWFAHTGDPTPAGHAVVGLAALLGLSKDAIAEILTGVSHAFTDEAIKSALEREPTEAPSFRALGRAVELIVVSTTLSSPTSQQYTNELAREIRRNWPGLLDDKRLAPNPHLGRISVIAVETWSEILADLGKTTHFRRSAPELREIAQNVLEKLQATYQRLLLLDEAAYREVMLNLAEADRSTLLQEFQKLAARLDAERLPPLTTYELVREARERNPRVTDGDYLFYYQLSDFTGRADALEILKAMLDDPEPFRWVRLTGSGGMGKSRLALELCLQATGWSSGFLDKTKPVSDWEGWIPQQNTLIVVDYANERYASLIT